jgi:hypothetical protein
LPDLGHPHPVPDNEKATIFVLTHNGPIGNVVVVGVVVGRGIVDVVDVVGTGTILHPGIVEEVVLKLGGSSVTDLVVTPIESGTRFVLNTTPSDGILIMLMIVSKS